LTRLALAKAVAFAIHLEDDCTGHAHVLLRRIGGPVCHIRAAKVLLLTGARVGELRWMLWQHVDLQAFVWDVPISKSGRPRRVYLGDAAVSALKDLRNVNEDHFLPTRPADVVFMNPRRRCAYNHFHSAWDRCRTRAELKSVRIHDLRHTYASILINKGVSLYEIQRLLGHHHITMTERYAHLLPNTLKSKVDLISGFIE